MKDSLCPIVAPPLTSMPQASTQSTSSTSFSAASAASNATVASTSTSPEDDRWIAPISLEELISRGRCARETTRERFKGVLSKLNWSPSQDKRTTLRRQFDTICAQFSDRLENLWKKEKAEYEAVSLFRFKVPKYRHGSSWIQNDISPFESNVSHVTFPTWIYTNKWVSGPPDIHLPSLGMARLASQESYNDTNASGRYRRHPQARTLLLRPLACARAPNRDKVLRTPGETECRWRRRT